MIFSRRTSWDLAEDDLSAAARQQRARGAELIDLTVSNPTGCGFLYPDDWLAPLADVRASQYVPEPFGMAAARESVAAYYRDHAAVVPVERICLTTSTSEAYSFLFRLLCDPGDEVLIARPSYPLFEFIAALDDVQLREYPLFYDPHAGDMSAGWSIDLHALAAGITPRTRAIIVVHPNNPTGNFASRTEQSELQQLCAKHDLALIVDEVFLDYAIDTAAAFTFAEATSPCLTFVLSGISKVCALPQMKASWMVACGPQALVHGAISRLEVIADTFLSMNAPVQFALPQWLAGRHAVQQQVRDRVAANLALLDRRVAGSLANRLAMQAGWAAVLRVPRTLAAADGSPTEFAHAALSAGVIVHPGEFYGLPAGRIVLSLLSPTALFQEGMERLPV